MANPLKSFMGGGTNPLGGMMNPQNMLMNMIYSDYCEMLGDNVTSYVRMAHKFLNDKDAPDGKALRYAMCMKKDYK